MQDEARDTVETVGGEPFTIPQSSAAPKPKRPKHRPEEINYADDDDVATKTLDWVKRYYNKFTEQSARAEFEENMNTADQLYRASATRTSLNTTESDNLKTTGSHVKSSSFFTDIRTISAYEKSVILGDRNQLPIVYTPIPKSSEYSEEEGIRISKEQNATLYWAFVEDNLWDKIGKLTLFANKYANQFIEMDWEYKTEDRIVREPTEWEERADGVKVPVKFKSKTIKDYVVKDCPTLVIHDNKDAWADAMIPDIQNQSCVIFRTQRQLGDLYNMQATAQILNAEKIGSSQAYAGENSAGGTDLLADRQINANESSDSSEPNTLIDVWYGYIRIPVDSDGKWDELNNLPRWHKFSYAGDINATPVATLIQPNRWGESIPVDCEHSHDDDKGLYHDGYVQRVKSILAQEMTTVDQAVDNWTARNCAPLVADDGSLLTRKKEFTDGRKPIIYVKAGARIPQTIETQDTTQLAVPMLRMLEGKRYEVMGINKTFRGEELGSRTSAGEALTVFDMAKKPAYEDIIYKGSQMLPFIAKWIMLFTRTYMDENKRIQISYDGAMYDVQPSNLYGDLKIKLTFVAQFENGLMAKKEMNDFFTQRLPIYIQAGVIGKKGLSLMAKQDMQNLYIKDADEMIERISNVEAERVAKMETEAILYHGVYDMPVVGEDDETHLKIHKAHFAQVALLPEEERPSKENMARMKLHIEMHEQNKEAAGQQNAQTAQMMQAQGEQPEGPRTPGEEMGDMLGGEGGADQNPDLGAIQGAQ